LPRPRCDRLARVATQRLGDEHGLAGRSDRLDGLFVQEVRQCHDHDIRVRMLDGRLHVGRGIGDAVTRLEGLATLIRSRIDHLDAVPAALAM